MWWWWWEQDYRGPRRTPSEVVCDTLMLELSCQSREAERAHRERQSEGQRLRSGVDYSWLQSSPCRSHSLSTGERLGLEELCAQVPPSHCGHTVLRFREAMQVHEPEPQEVSSVFRTVLLQTLEGVREQQEAQRLERQWNTQRRSVSLLNFRTRLRVNPFSSAQDEQQGAQLSLKTISQDVERGVQDQEQDQEQDQQQDQGRVWSVPDFRHQRGKVL